MITIIGRNIGWWVLGRKINIPWVETEEHIPQVYRVTRPRMVIVTLTSVQRGNADISTGWNTDLTYI
jgi:hypothetical protein